MSIPHTRARRLVAANSEWQCREVNERARSRSALDACAGAFDQCLHFAQRSLRDVARCAHCQRTVSRAVFHSSLHVAKLQNPINKTTGKTVATANTIKNFEVSQRARFKKFALSPRNRPPIISCGGMRGPERRRDYFEV